jgi:2-polyprenyl-3-methyl-5-hydroxy-6-metoxy-1,4-benzoquinol methylase
MRNESNPIFCPVCKHDESSYYMTTRALMHSSNKECYIFNKCLLCEAVFLTNGVSEESLNEYYTDNYLPYKGPSAWGKFSSFVERSQRKLDQKRVDFVDSVTEKKGDFNMLDVGCGNPSFLELLQQRLHAKCTGIDFSDKGWKGRSYNEIELIKTAVADFEPAQLFDVITLWHYLEHDYHLHDTVEKLYSCLKPGGKLIIEVPDYKSLSAGIQKQFWQGWHSPRHLTLFTEKAFRILFPDEKWEITKYLRYGTLDAFTLWWLGKMEKKGTNWSGSMEKEFWPLVFFKVVSFPIFLFEKIIPMGLQIVVIEKKQVLLN